MKLELPEFKRCCCCIPLRYGLLFIGYIKLIASLCFLGMMVTLLSVTISRIQILTSSDRRMTYYIWDIMILVFLTLIVLLDISMNVVFIVGGHKKNPKLIKVFYYYNIVMLCLYTFAFSVSTTMDLMFEIPYVLRSPDLSKIKLFIIKAKIGGGILNAVIQIYFILLTRSEVKKLENHSKFRFKNNAAEAECKMEPEIANIEAQTNEDTEKITEDNVNDINVDVARNNNINHEPDEKLKINKYRQIKNADV